MRLSVQPSHWAAQVLPDSSTPQRRKATVVGWWWLVLLLSLSGQLWAQQVSSQQEPPKVTSFTLVNAATGQAIQPLKAGDVLDLAALPAQLSVRANTDPWRVGSVVFDLNEKTAIQVENSPPYALASNLPDSSFLFLAQFGRTGSGHGRLQGPSGLTLDDSGNLYVLDEGNNRIQKFGPTGRFLFQFGSQGSGQGQFSYPRGGAVDGSGNLYVVDLGNHRVQKFDSLGHFLSQFGSYGSGQGQFLYPSGVTVDGSGQVYVADYSNHRIQKFDPEGRFLFQFGSQGSSQGQFNELNQVVVGWPWTAAVMST